MDIDLAVRYLLGGVMLAGALIPDLRVRRVPNQWWMPFTAAAIVLLVTDVAADRAWIPVAVALLLCAAFYAMWRFGLFGGADAKALMVLAILVPRTPHPLPLPIPPAIDALANGSLILVALPVVLFLYNAARGDWAAAMWLGVRMDAVEAQRRHVWPMQGLDAEGKVRWRFWQSIGMDLGQTYAGLHRAGFQRVWATPKIPLIGALLVGLAISWRWGNLVVLGAAAATGAP